MCPGFTVVGSKEGSWRDSFVSQTGMLIECREHNVIEGHNILTCTSEDYGSWNEAIPNCTFVPGDYFMCSTYHICTIPFSHVPYSHVPHTSPHLSNATKICHYVNSQNHQVVYGLSALQIQVTKKSGWYIRKNPAADITFCVLPIPHHPSRSHDKPCYSYQAVHPVDVQWSLPWDEAPSRQSQSQSRYRALADGLSENACVTLQEMVYSFIWKSGNADPVRSVRIGPVLKFAASAFPAENACVTWCRDEYFRDLQYSAVWRVTIWEPAIRHQKRFFIWGSAQVLGNFVTFTQSCFTL